MWHTPFYFFAFAAMDRTYRVGVIRFVNLRHVHCSSRVLSGA
jgi:hypothetical protein